MPNLVYGLDASLDVEMSLTILGHCDFDLWHSF